MPHSYSFLTGQSIINASKAEGFSAALSNITALQETTDGQLHQWIKTLQHRFCRFAHTRHTAGGWSWMKKSKPFLSYGKTTLNGAVAASAATVILSDASNFDSAGRIVIETSKGSLDFVDYSSKSSNTLTVSTATGAETVAIAHATAERVEKLYALPSDYAKTHRLMMNDDVEFIPSRDTVLFPAWRYYTEYGAYIFLPRDVGSQEFTLYYVRKPNTLTALSTETDIPEDVMRWAVEETLVHFNIIRRKRSDIATARTLAEEELMSFLQYDQSFTAKSASRGIRTGTF